MEFPESILSKCREASRKHANDIPKAIEEAERNIRALPEFREWAGSLITQAISDLVYAARHTDNQAIKRRNGSYGGQAKVNPAASSEVKRLYDDLYQYRIGGRTLGDLKGSELKPIADHERSIAANHTLNALLLESLIKEPGFDEDKPVRDFVKPQRLKTIYQRCEKKSREST